MKLYGFSKTRAYGLFILQNRAGNSYCHVTRTGTCSMQGNLVLFLGTIYP